MAREVGTLISHSALAFDQVLTKQEAKKEELAPALYKETAPYKALTTFSFIALKRYLEQYGVCDSSIRYRATASLAHPASEVSAVAYEYETATFTIDVSFMGLYGTQSPMPVYYTETVLDDITQNSEGSENQLKSFYDLFNHQAVALFYDAWCKYKLPYRFSMGSTTATSLIGGSKEEGGDEFSHALLALWGLDQHRIGQFKRLTFPHLLKLSALLACRTQSPERLSQALNILFESNLIGLSVFNFRQIPIPSDQLCRLGVENAELGETTVLGGTVIDCSGIQVNVTLNNESDLNRWLPEGQCNEMARELITLMLGASFDVEITVRLSSNSIRSVSLGDELGRLGRNCCLTEKITDSDTTIFV